MTQFKDYVSKELCFHILYVQLCCLLGTENQDSLNSQICRGSSSCRPPETGVNSAIFFLFGSPHPHRMRSAYLQVWLHLLFLLCPTTCSFPTGWHSVGAHTSLTPCLWLQHNEPPLPTCLPVQHSRSNSGKKHIWNLSQKTTDRADSLTLAPQKWHSCCSNLIKQVWSCLCQGGQGEERLQASRTQDYHFLPVELIMCNFTKSWIFTIKTTRGLGGMGTETCLLLAYFQEHGYSPPAPGSCVCT